MGPTSPDPMNWTLAADYMGTGAAFVTNHPYSPDGKAYLVFVVPGTGVVWGGVRLDKPHGPASGFPYGFNVTPDRPLTYSV